jgi:hypothetical protein
MCFIYYITLLSLLGFCVLWLVCWTSRDTGNPERGLNRMVEVLRHVHRPQAFGNQPGNNYRYLSKALPSYPLLHSIRRFWIACYSLLSRLHPSNLSHCQAAIWQSSPQMIPTSEARQSTLTRTVISPPTTQAILMHNSFDDRGTPFRNWLTIQVGSYPAPMRLYLPLYVRWERSVKAYEFETLLILRSDVGVLRDSDQATGQRGSDTQHAHHWNWKSITHHLQYESLDTNLSHRKVHLTSCLYKIQ